MSLVTAGGWFEGKQYEVTLCTSTNCPGVILHGGVPEPATWAMMLLGAGLVGGGLRMARRKDMALTAA